MPWTGLKSCNLHTPGNEGSPPPTVPAHPHVFLYLLLKLQRSPFYPNFYLFWQLTPIPTSSTISENTTWGRKSHPPVVTHPLCTLLLPKTEIEPIVVNKRTLMPLMTKYSSSLYLHLRPVLLFHPLCQMTTPQRAAVPTGCQPWPPQRCWLWVGTPQMAGPLMGRWQRTGWVLPWTSAPPRPRPPQRISSRSIWATDCCQSGARRQTLTPQTPTGSTPSKQSTPTR